MAEFTAPGPRLDLDGPRPVIPPHSLLNTPGVVQEPSVDGRWLSSAAINGYPEDTPSLWEPCSEGTFRTKGEGGEHPMPVFDAFVVYIADTCSTFGARDLNERTEAVLNATQSMGVEEALASGIVGSANPFFGDANLTVLGGAAVTAAAGLSFLENAIGLTGRGGMIHATPAIVSALNADKVVFQQEGGLYTINGTPVVSGDGYIGSDPVAEASPAAGQDYMYATGPVEVRLGPMATSTLRESLERDTNTVTIRSERYVLATWDTALQVAVLVDWTP